MIDLTAEEQRVLGALMEKQYVTPDVYPMTMNALVSACNQVSNRNPVVSYDEAVIHAALDRLREKGLTRVVHSPSNRATKYRQVFEETRQLRRSEAAVLGVLLLRGPQTVGELRTRTERIHAFESLAEVEEVLERLSHTGLIEEDGPFVRRLERQAGQKEARYGHLLGESAAVDEAPAPGGATGPAPTGPAPTGLAAEVRQLRADLDALRAEFEAFRDELL
jgi:uncharacterized protein YceH (UPF0502 family)